MKMLAALLAVLFLIGCPKPKVLVREPNGNIHDPETCNRLVCWTECVRTRNGE